MNNTTLRDNKAKFSPVAIGQIKNGFERALIWQDDQLDDHAGSPLSFEAQQKCDQVIAVFMSLVCADDIAVDQVLKHGLTNTGHDIALQMLGHGVGFWEQKSTNKLDQILDFLIDMKAIEPFTLFYCDTNNNLQWDLA